MPQENPKEIDEKPPEGGSKGEDVVALKAQIAQMESRLSQFDALLSAPYSGHEEEEEIKEAAPEKEDFDWDKASVKDASMRLSKEFGNQITALEKRLSKVVGGLNSRVADESTKMELDNLMSKNPDLKPGSELWKGMLGVAKNHPSLTPTQCLKLAKADVLETENSGFRKIQKEEKERKEAKASVANRGEIPPDVLSKAGKAKSMRETAYELAGELGLE